MAFRITKDCGAGWDEWRDSGESSWGVSEKQHRLATKVKAGDVFLHFIDHVQAWAGYSEVIGSLRKTDRNSNEDWADALPWVIPVKRRRCLTKNACQVTVEIRGLSHTNFHRQVTFTTISDSDGRRITSAIDDAQKVAVPMPPAEFESDWLDGAEGYYSDIVKARANGKCAICGMTAASWMKHAGIAERVSDAITDGFLDAAHIIPRRENGPVTPDNIRALCPNCHRAVDRLSPNQIKKILGGRSK